MRSRLMEELVREAAQKVAERQIEWLRAQPGIAQTEQRIRARWAERERVLAAQREAHGMALAEEAARSATGPRRIAPIPMRKAGA